MRKIDFLVTDEQNDKNVAYVLSENGVSKRLITKLKQIPDGITKNNQHARTIDIVKNGDIISILLLDEKFLIEAPDLNVPIIYEDNDVIVFDKPPYMPVHPSLNHPDDTLGNYFAYHCRGISFRPVNRLDRDTSGLCVVAKNSFSAQQLQKSLSKVYYAVVEGKTQISDTINAPIARENDTIIKRCVNENGQTAVTHYETLKQNDKLSLVRVCLETGRTHQIRVHFSYIGHPLYGDSMYGGDTSLLKRQALHCGEISFTHPITRSAINLKTDIPSDMSDLLNHFTIYKVVLL